MRNDNKVFIELFKADWCGHCTNFLPTWNKMKEHSTTKKEYSNFVFNMYDDKTHTKRIKGKEQRGLKIKGYPSLYVCYKDKAVEYNGHMSQEKILEFTKNIVKRQYGGNNRKMIRGKGFTYYGRGGEMRGGGRVYADDVDLVELVNSKEKATCPRG